MFKNKEYRKKQAELKASQEAAAKAAAEKDEADAAEKNELKAMGRKKAKQHKLAKKKSDKYGVSWTADENTKACSLCHRAFSVVRRRHHCRKCGGIFCDKCSKSKMKLEGSKNKKRVCDTCVANAATTLETETETEAERPDAARAASAEQASSSDDKEVETQEEMWSPPPAAAAGSAETAQDR